MTISIIIPSYNQAEYLSDAIESALDQTVKAKEIVVIDDGSTDSSLELALSYAKKGVKVVSQVNKGLASARNTGIMNVSGDYILPLDADDILKENCLEVILEKIKETDADVVSPSFKTFGMENHEVILMENPTLNDFKMANRIAYCSAVKRSVLLEVGGYSPRMAKGYEDFHLWFNLLTLGKKFVTIQEILFLYRTRKDSMINESVKHHEELMAQIEHDFHIYD